MGIKKTLLIAAVVTCAVPAVIIDTPIAYIPLVFLLIFCAVSLLYALLSACFCRLDAEPPGFSRYERESSAVCHVTISNKSLLMLSYVSLTLSVESLDGFSPITSEHLFALRPKERMTLTLPIKFPHIGRYKIKISKLRFYGFLGVLHVDKHPKWVLPVHVTPKLRDMPGLCLNISQAVMAVDFNMPNKISGGEYSDVRPYAPGDPLKNIHWKLSAHSSEYITRLFKTDAVSGVSVYIDLALPPSFLLSAAEINDNTAESAYAAAALALRQNYHVELIYARSGVQTVDRPKNMTELTAAVYYLPPVSVNGQYPIELLVAEHSGNMLSPDNVVVITAALSERLSGVLLDLRRKGKSVTLYCPSSGGDVYELEEIA